jgi:hypothetical protein
MSWTDIREGQRLEHGWKSLDVARKIPDRALYIRALRTPVSGRADLADRLEWTLGIGNSRLGVGDDPAVEVAGAALWNPGSDRGRDGNGVLGARLAVVAAVADIGAADP